MNTTQPTYIYYNVVHNEFIAMNGNDFESIHNVDADNVIYANGHPEYAQSIRFKEGYLFFDKSGSLRTLEEMLPIEEEAQQHDIDFACPEVQQDIRNTCKEWGIKVTGKTTTDLFAMLFDLTRLGYDAFISMYGRDVLRKDLKV